MAGVESTARFLTNAGRKWYYAKRFPDMTNPDLCLHGSGEFISDQIRSTGCYYEPQILDYLWRNCDFSRYLDVGANLGNHSNFFMRRGACDWAIEPAASNLALLRQNAPDFTIFPFAAGDSSATMTLVDYGSCHGNAHLRTFVDENAGIGTQATTQAVQVVRIDDLGIEAPTLVKIDVEGSELAALRGARSTLMSSYPDICIEIHRDATLRTAGFRYTKEQLEAELESLGYVGQQQIDATNFLFTRA